MDQILSRFATDLRNETLSIGLYIKDFEDWSCLFKNTGSRLRVFHPLFTHIVD